MNAIMQRRGVAFIVVLWLLALVSIILGSFALMARGESLQARHLLDTTQGRYAAEAGVNLAVFALAAPDPLLRWVPDGRTYTQRYAGAKIEIQVIDESGKLDINAADVTLLGAFLQGSGMEELEAQALAAAIVDWRDPDDLIMPNGAEDDEYADAERNYGPKNALFDTLSELQQVLGMNHALYQRLAPSLTIHSGMSVPNVAFAPAAVLQALPGVDPALVEMLIAQRQAFDPGLGEDPPTMPDGSPLVAQGGSGTYTVRSRATLANGAWTQLDTTVRLGGAALSGLAYTVLRWQEGEPL
jgi:general secretion pathway protein K